MIVLEMELTKNVNEVFEFSCVKSVYKHEGIYWYMCIIGEDVVALKEGDALLQESDGSWSYKRKMRDEKDNKEA